MSESKVFDKADWLKLYQLIARAKEENQPLLWIINDPERPTRSDLVLKYFFQHSQAPYPEFHLFVATGSHRFSEKEQQEFEKSILGPFSTFFSSITWNDTSATFVSQTTPSHFQINETLLRFPFWVLIGSIEPHYFSGTTGAHKTLAIGCSGLEALRANHELALQPKARILHLWGNPVFDDQFKRYQKAKSYANEVLAIQLVQKQEQVCYCEIGTARSTLEHLFPFAKKLFTKNFSAPLPLLLLQVTGPLSVSLYQAEKAIKNNEWIVPNGGTIVLRASCSKGIGPPRFLHLLKKYKTYQKAKENLVPYQLGDHKALKLLYLTDPEQRGVKVFLCAEGISATEAKSVRMEKISIEKWEFFLNQKEAYLLKNAEMYSCQQTNTSHTGIES